LVVVLGNEGLDEFEVVGVDVAVLEIYVLEHVPLRSGIALAIHLHEV
jgi:hypothetical protein